MDNHYYNSQKLQIRKRQTLHSIIVGFVYFIIIYLFTRKVDGSICPIKNIFGISCFGCGMTRGFIAILKLDFKSALNYNILSLPMFIGICLYAFFTIIDLLSNNNYIYKIEKILSRIYMIFVYIVILVFATIINNLIFTANYLASTLMTPSCF